MISQDKQEKLEHYLREQRTPYRVLPGPPSTAMPSDAGETKDRAVKVIMVNADGRPILAIIPDLEQLDMGKTAAAVGAGAAHVAQNRIFGGAFGETESQTMLPFGNLYGLPVYVDISLIWSENIVFRVGWSAECVAIPYREFVRLVRPVTADLVASPS